MTDVKRAEDELFRAIDVLPPKLRVIAELSYIGYNRAEIAEMLSVDIRTVNNRMTSIHSPRIRELIDAPSPVMATR